MQGWIKLHREIMDNDMWLEKPFARGQAWVDLLLLANHADKNAYVNGQLVTVLRGELVTSNATLCKRWGWSNTKVIAFLNELVESGSITKKTSHRYTLLNISNYAAFQGFCDAEKEGENTTETLLKHYRNTTETPEQECKEGKEPPPSPPKENPLKGVKEKVPSPPPTDAQMIAQQLDDYTDNPVLRDDLNAFLEMRKKIRKPMTPYAVKLALNRLSGFAKDDKTKSAILQQSIEASWQGIFPLREQTQTRAWTPQEQQLSPLDRLAHQEINWEDLEAVE